MYQYPVIYRSKRSVVAVTKVTVTSRLLFTTVSLINYLLRRFFSNCMKLPTFIGVRCSFFDQPFSTMVFDQSHGTFHIICDGSPPIVWNLAIGRSMFVSISSSSAMVFRQSHFSVSGFCCVHDTSDAANRSKDGPGRRFHANEARLRFFF